MPRPNDKETRESFLHRFMGSEEARRDHADEKQRFAIGCSLWDNRDTLEAANALGYNAERDGAEPFGGPHIQPGVVNYPELRNPVTGAQGIALLIEKPTLDRMRASMRGVPVINWEHDMSGGAEKWLAEGKAVGVVVGSVWDGDLGYDRCEAMVWEKEAKANARGGFRWSNAWKEDDIDWTPGVHNGVKYDGRLIAGHYTHLAIVPNPRYEGAVIFANSLGGIMKLFGFGKDDKGVELAKDAVLDIAGKKYPLAEVVNSIAAAEAEKAKVSSTAKDGILGEKDTIEIGEKNYSLAEVTNALAAAEKAKAAALPPAPEPKKDEVKPFETPEFHNAVKAAAEKLVGEGFFNGVKALAERRGAEDLTTKARVPQTERERVAAGAKRFGRKAEPKA